MLAEPECDCYYIFFPRMAARDSALMSVPWGWNAATVSHTLVIPSSSRMRSCSIYFKFAYGGDGSSAPWLPVTVYDVI